MEGIIQQYLDEQIKANRLSFTSEQYQQVCEDVINWLVATLPDVMSDWLVSEIKDYLKECA